MSTDLLQVFTTKQVAEMMQVTTQAVAKWIRDGHLQAFRAGDRGDWRVTRSDLEEYISGRRSNG